MQDETGDIRRREQQVRPERHVGPVQPDRPADVVAGRHLPPLVELPIRRQVGLRHDAEHRAAVDDDRGVVDAVPVPQRRADHQHRQQLGGGGDDVEQRILDGIEQGVLQQDVLDRVPRQRQLGKHRQRHVVVMAVLGRLQHRLGVRGGVGDHRADRAGGHADETVPVGRVEVHTDIVAPNRARITEDRGMQIP